MLNPERAVLVKGGDALLRRDVLCTPGFVVVRTKSTIACLAGPSFHEGNGSWAWARVWPASTTTSRTKVRRRNFMVNFWVVRRPTLSRYVFLKPAPQRKS